MDRLRFNKGVLRGFIEKVQMKMGLNIDQLAKVVGISGRTLRDWKREKFNPDKDKIQKMGKLSGVSVPTSEVLPRYWYVVKGASLGGKKRYELHGILGTVKDRSKGGKASWEKRIKDFQTWVKYTNSIREPEESEDLAEFMGIMLGDGGLTHFQCTVYLNSEIDKDFANYVSNLVLKLFGIKPKIYRHKKNKVLRVSVSSVNLVEYLISKGLCLGNKVHLQVGVPIWVLRKPEYIKACIRGLVDTDGSIVIHNYKVRGEEYSYPRLSFSNRSQPLLDFMYEGLKSFGFNPKKSYKYEISLHGIKDVREYLEMIGVSNYKPNIKKLGWVARVA